MKVELLGLFKSFIGSKTNEVNSQALSYGLLIPTTASDEIVQEAIKMYGKDGMLWNQTFHKSWDKVANAPIMQLYLEQIMHYFTTYGFEALGCYSESTVYVPTEKLEVPDVEIDKIKFTVINALTEDEIKEKMMTLVTSGIALSDQTVKDIKALSDFIDKNRFDEVVNREVRTFLYDKYHIMPSNPEAFLRYLIFKTTGATLKIQNVATYNALAHADKSVVLNMLKSYRDLAKLSSIFLRNKNLFLALKSTTNTSEEQKEINSIINKLRKLAKKNHKAIKPALLDNLTNATKVNEDEVIEALEKVTLFRAIRILNALAYRKNGNKDIVYRVRNGKSFVSTVDKSNEAVINKAYNIVFKYVTDKLRDKVEGKSVYIPQGFTYKAPTTEKQFIGNIPEGSYYKLPADENLVFAVHWTNLTTDENKTYSGKRVDLDMHVMNANQQFGWNTSYRDQDCSILFSGDITDAPLPNGATEAYFISKKMRDNAFLITLNDFNGHTVDVPFEFCICRNNDYFDAHNKNYVIDPNNIVTKFNMKITPDKRQITLGMVKADQKTKCFYFNDFGVGSSCAVTTRNEYTVGAFNYLNAYSEVQITLNELLEKSGAVVSETPSIKVQKAEIEYDENKQPKAVIKEIEVPVDIDLSIENIDKTNIIELLTK